MAPVPIPSGPLPITDSDRTRAETMLSSFFRSLMGGSVIGSSVDTPPVMVSIPGFSEPQPLEMATESKQLFYRHLAIAVAQLTASGGGGIQPYEVATRPAPNKIPRAYVDGTIDPGWVDTQTPVFVAACQEELEAGDLVCIASAGEISRVDITSKSKMPCVGVISGAVDDSSYKVITNGPVRGIYSGLTPGRMYFAGSDGRPTITPPVPTSGEIFVQPLGVSLDATTLILNPSMNLTKIGAVP